jgi:hypothetical protein
MEIVIGMNMKKYIIISVLVLFSFIFQMDAQAGDNEEYPFCVVTLEGDYYATTTLRDVLERTVSNNANGGCNVRGSENKKSNGDYIYADADYAKNVIFFQTPNNTGNNHSVENFKINYDINGDLQPININLMQSVILGNITPEAIKCNSNPTGDGSCEVDYDENDSRYKLNGSIPDTGIFYLDLTAFEGMDATSGKTGIRCSSDSKKLKIRSLAIADKNIKDLNTWLNHTNHSCLQHAGDISYCYGDFEKNDNGNYVDPKNADLKSDWCNPACSEELITVYRDKDGDGYGDADNAYQEQICPEGDNDIPAGYVEDDGDCDDDNIDIHPGADEYCDEIDYNCDGDPYLDAVDTNTYYEDADGDTYGNPDAPDDLCEDQANDLGYVEDDTDCNDADAAINPGAIDECNDDGIDYDCDGEVIPGTEWYPDVDGDGYGDMTATPSTLCENPGAMVEEFTDCDDADPAAYPGAAEECDAANDYNCDGTIDVCESHEDDTPGGCGDEIDNDGDGLIDCVDVDDCSDEPECAGEDPGEDDYTNGCEDEVDNDGDGDIDCDDDDCASETICLDGEDDYDNGCDDGEDNDGDIAVDCGDNDCHDEEVCDDADTEDGDPDGDGIDNCEDGIDNDGDGALDCYDSDCADDDVCDDMPEICNDGIDNDGDGDADCDDADCATWYSCSPIETDPEIVCDNGLDDDADGAFDCDDADCAFDDVCVLNPDPGIIDPDPDTGDTDEICDNGIDDDGDNFIDCLDSDCQDFQVAEISEDEEAGIAAGTFFCADTQVGSIPQVGKVSGYGEASNHIDCSLSTVAVIRPEQKLNLAVLLMLFASIFMVLRLSNKQRF